MEPDRRLVDDLVVAERELEDAVLTTRFVAGESRRLFAAVGRVRHLVDALAAASNDTHGFHSAAHVEEHEPKAAAR